MRSWSYSVIKVEFVRMDSVCGVGHSNCINYLIVQFFSVARI